MLLEIWENCRQNCHIERRQLQAFVEMLAAAFSFCIFRVSKFKIKVVPLHPSWDYRNEKGTWNGKQVSSASSWRRFNGDEQHGCLLCARHRCCGGSCNGISVVHEGCSKFVQLLIIDVQKIKDRLLCRYYWQMQKSCLIRQTGSLSPCHSSNQLPMSWPKKWQGWM